MSTLMHKANAQREDTARVLVETSEWSLSASFQVHRGRVMNVRGYRPEPQRRGGGGVSRGITSRRDHAAYGRCMRSLVDEMWSIPLTFYREKVLIRHVLTAGAVGCENPLSSRISSHSECFLPLFIYLCTLIWGLCEMLHFMRKWEKRERKGVLKRQRRGMNRGARRSCSWFLFI